VVTGHVKLTDLLSPGGATFTADSPLVSITGTLSAVAHDPISAS
jgi:hypothetical protein